MSRSTAWTALLCCLLFWHGSSQAIDNIQLQIGQWAFDDYAAEQFDITVNLTEKGLHFTATADSLILAKPWGPLRAVRLSCEQLNLQGQTWQCVSGQLSFQNERLGRQQLSFSLQATPQNQSYQINLSGLKLAEATLNVIADYQPSGWSMDIRASQLSLKALSGWLPFILTEQQNETLSAWQYQGLVNLDAKLKGQYTAVSEIKLDWQFHDLSFSNGAGTQVAEGLSAKGQLNGKLTQQQWQWQTKIKADNGQVYSEPIFLDLNQQPVAVDAEGSLAADFEQVDISQLTIEQQNVMNARASLSWVDSEIKRLQFETQQASLLNLYAIWLQPFTLGTAAAKLDVSGEVAVKLDWQPDNYQLQLNFDEAYLNDEQERFSLKSLSGHFGWSNSDKKLDTALNWSGAKLFAVELGEASIRADSVNNSLALTEPLNLPVLDGSLQVNAFELQQKNDGHVDWHFDGLLTPVSMESLSQALAWPTLHGKLSGVIPRVSYSNQQLRIDGALQVKVFDGTTVIRDLRMSTPFGSLPQLYGNVDINHLDLELLTSAFDFGRITGRVDGYVHNLRLSNWEPVQFDARLATSETNPGKRRISQKAVDNLTQIGGGATGMLSRSFLRFFDDFSYQKLGLSCHLQNDVCQMSGIEEAEQGYYIVKGGGGLPPWINVVGYTRRVDWADLIARLMAVRDSSGPVIE